MGATGALAALSIGATVTSGFVQAASQRAAAKFQKGIFDYNAKVAEAQATIAEQRGSEMANRARQKARRLIGSQRAALGAQGLDPNAPASLDIQTETALIGELDAMTIRNNAALEAWGFRTQATGFTSQGRLASFAGRSKAVGSIISAGASVARTSFDIFGRKSLTVPTATDDFNAGIGQLEFE